MIGKFQAFLMILVMIYATYSAAVFDRAVSDRIAAEIAARNSK